MPEKKRILFVDDEQKITDGLRRMLRGMRQEWDMAFAIGAKEALEILGRSSFDVIVSDMRMPLVDGPELLTEVSKRHPQVVRIALSGHSEKEMVLRSVRSTHQYLAKPCDIHELKDTVRRACILRDLLRNDALQRLVSRMESIPSLPSLYLELNEELESPDCSMKKVGEIISKDMGMCAKILQLVNSAFFGIKQRVSCPIKAASFVGTDTIRALALSLHIFSPIDQKKLEAFHLDELCHHSLTTGLFAREIAKTENQTQNQIDNAFTSGLLHDIGKLLLVVELSEQYRQVLDLARREYLDLIEAERRILDGTHAEIGGYLLAIWGLDDPIVEAVCFHHAPMMSLDSEFSSLTAVHVANVLEVENNISNRIEPKPQVDKGYLTQLGMIDRLPVWREICQGIMEKGAQNEREDTHR